jgi:GH25 family lysozyme M1 (1,4-beta-N-acetylmuramidase)
MRGIDVAKWNVVNDYSRLANSGVEFAIVKVINASNRQEDSLQTHVSGFKSVGITCNMGYTYSYANTKSKASSAAEAFVNVAKAVGIDYLWLDLEDVSMRGLGHLLVDIINTYKDVATRNGFKFGIYTYSSYYNSYIKKYISELEGIPFWIARYPSTKDMAITDDVPSGSSLPNGIDISGWQYSSNGIVAGVSGRVDLDVWYEESTVTNDIPVTIDVNPFTEPETNCKVGTIGNDANWVLWYLWRFGKLLDADGAPDSTQIDGVYGNGTAEKVKQVQALLGLTADGIVGKQTRAVWKKIA